MGDAVGKLFLVVRHHDECLTGTLAEQTDNLSDETAIAVVQAVQRLVEDEEFRVLYESTGQQTEPLLATAETEKGCISHMLYAEDSHPTQARPTPLRTRTDIETNGIA